jgi:hypothetical protein
MRAPRLALSVLIVAVLLTGRCTAGSASADAPTAGGIGTAPSAHV